MLVFWKSCTRQKQRVFVEVNTRELGSFHRRIFTPMRADLFLFRRPLTVNLSLGSGVRLDVLLVSTVQSLVNCW